MLVMKKFLLFTSILMYVNNSISQQQNVATIVSTETNEVNIHFIYKILIMLFLGVVAFISYLQYRKTEH